jgi:potassium efflux system protein
VARRSGVIGDLVGSVEHIGLRSTEIITADQVSIIVPISRFLESEVITWSHGGPLSRLRLPVGVSYGSDLRVVRKALVEAAATHPDILRFPAPQLWFCSFASSSLDMDLYVMLCRV